MCLKILLFFLIVNFVSDSYGQRDTHFFRKDYNYIQAFKIFYKIHTIPQTWAEAKRVCALEGATFWHPDNEVEAHGLISFWNKTKPYIEWMYVGLSDLLVEGVFQTVDGESASQVYNNWRPGEPYGNGDCALIILKQGPGYLVDSECGKKNSFVCKKSLQSLEWNYECNMPYLDYSYNKANGKCYKLHTTPLNWTEAYSMCQVEQSDLAVISNRLEADYREVNGIYTETKVQRELSKRNLSPRLSRQILRGLADSSWYMRTRMNVDWDAWFDNYQPDGDNHEECGSMFFNGRLVNTACDMRSFFICEHEVDTLTAPVTNGLTDSEKPILQPYVSGGIEK